jgi:hypothetical protein
MIDPQGGDESARQHIERLFSTQRINNVSVSITPLERPTWGEPLNTGWFGIPGGNGKFAVHAARMPIDHWLNLQQSVYGADTESFINGAYPETVEKAQESVETGSVSQIPAPVLEIGKEYSVDTQEGRSRAIGAQQGGADTIDIWIAARRQQH